MTFIENGDEEQEYYNYYMGELWEVENVNKSSATQDTKELISTKG